MQIVSLFAGIGGFELAGKWMGWDTVLSCEIDPFCQRVLKYHFPNTFIHDNVKTFGIETLKKTKWNPSAATIVVGGFP